MSVTATHGTEFPVILTGAATGIAADLTVGVIDSDAHDVISQSGVGIAEIAAPSGLYEREPGLIAPDTTGTYFVVWKLSGATYATEDLQVIEGSTIGGVAPLSSSLTLKPNGYFPPGSTVDIYQLDSIPGAKPPVSVPPVDPFRSDVAVRTNGTIVLESMPGLTDFLAIAIVDGELRQIAFKTAEVAAGDAQGQMDAVVATVNAETALRIQGDSNEASARAAGDSAEASARNAGDAAEAAARATGDSNEASTRAAADVAEVTARNAAITSSVATEATARTAADAAEVTARNAAITSAVATETTARTAADAAEVTARNTADKARKLKGGEYLDVTENTITSGNLPTDGTTDALPAWNNLIAAINTGVYAEVEWPAGTFVFDGNPNAITANDVTIHGQGPATIIKKKSTSATGKFFTVGVSAGAGPSRVLIHGFQLRCNAANGPPNTASIPPATDHAFHLVKGGTIHVRDITCLEIGGLAEVGTAADVDDRVQLYGFERVRGNWNSATPNPARIHIVNATDGVYHNIRLTDTEVNGGIGIHADASGASPITDQHIFSNCEIWGMGSHSENTAAGVNYPGITWNVKLDFSHAPVFNWTFKNCVFDEGVSGAVWLRSDAATSQTCKDIHFDDCHMACAGGRGIYIDHQGSASMSSIQVNGGRIRTKEGVALELHGANVDSFGAVNVNLLQEQIGYALSNLARHSIVHTFAHGRSVDDPVVFSGSPPSPLVAGTTYYVKDADANSNGFEFTVAASTPATPAATVAVVGGVSGSYRCITPAHVQFTDCDGVRVTGCFMGPFEGGATSAVTNGVKALGSPDHMAITGNVAPALTGGFSTGITASATKVLANNAT